MHSLVTITVTVTVAVMVMGMSMVTFAGCMATQFTLRSKQVSKPDWASKLGRRVENAKCKVNKCLVEEHQISTSSTILTR